MFNFRKNGDNRGALSQQGVRTAAGRGLCPAGAAVHRDYLLLLPAQVARTAQAHVIITLNILRLCSHTIRRCEHVIQMTDEHNKRYSQTTSVHLELSSVNTVVVYRFGKRY